MDTQFKRLLLKNWRVSATRIALTTCIIPVFFIFTITIINWYFIRFESSDAVFFRWMYADLEKFIDLDPFKRFDSDFSTLYHNWLISDTFLSFYWAFFILIIPQFIIQIFIAIEILISRLLYRREVFQNYYVNLEINPLLKQNKIWYLTNLGLIVIIILVTFIIFIKEAGINTVIIIIQIEAIIIISIHLFIDIFFSSKYGLISSLKKKKMANKFFLRLMMHRTEALINLVCLFYIISIVTVFIFMEVVIPTEKNSAVTFEIVSKSLIEKVKFDNYQDQELFNNISSQVLEEKLFSDRKETEKYRKEMVRWIETVTRTIIPYFIMLIIAIYLVIPISFQQFNKPIILLACSFITYFIINIAFGYITYKYYSIPYEYTKALSITTGTCILLSYIIGYYINIKFSRDKNKADA